jgi:hypothetical protein
MLKQYITLSFNCHSLIFATYLLPFPLGNQQRSTTARPFSCCSFFPSANFTSRKRPCRLVNTSLYIQKYYVFASRPQNTYKGCIEDVCVYFVLCTFYFTLQDERRPRVRSKWRMCKLFGLIFKTKPQSIRYP